MKNDKEKEPFEKKSPIPEASDFQGVDKDPEEEKQKGQDEKIENDDLKDKDVDRRI